MFKEKIFLEAVKYDRGDAKRIQHFTKVCSYASLIAAGEKMNEVDRNILEIAAILHDIGIHEAERLYNSTSGKYQEQLGPQIAENIIRNVIRNNESFEECVTENQIERIKYLIGHHHTYSDINGLDYQILVEADFLVNMYEDDESIESVRIIYNKIFKTKTGKSICSEMFNIN